MPDPNSIPFKQAAGNGHYESKQLPNDNQDFLAILGLPISLGNVTSVTTPSRDGQLATYWQTGGLTIKGSTAIGIVDLVDGVVTTRLSPAGDIVGTLGAQTLIGKTLTNCVLTAPTGLTKADVGLGNVDNTSDANKPVSTATQTQLNLKEATANKNVANGYAGLDAGGKVAASQMPLSVIGAVNYQGTWNASTNVPAIPTAAAGNEGWYYVVSVAGTVAVSGVSSWGVGDWLVSNGSSWDKIDNTDAVASVAGKTGVVVLDRADVQLGNVDNTSDAAKNSAAATLTNKVISGASNSLTVRLNADVVNNLSITNLNNGIGATDQTWWCGDGQWKAPSGAGDVVGPAGAADGEIVLFQGATGKLIRRPVADEITTAIAPSVWSLRMRSYNAVGNPNFEVDQRNVGAGVTNPAGVFLQDRWTFTKTGTMTVNSTRPTATPMAPGTNFRLSSVCQTVTLATQQASLAAGDFCALQQAVEAPNLRELYADVHSVSLLVRSSVAPLKFGVALRDTPATRSLCKLCTISSANTWTLVTLPNLPVWAAGGNWNFTPGSEGYRLLITLAAGTTFTAPVNDTWQTGNYLGAPGQDNFFSKTVGSTFDVGFVQHEPGAVCSGLMDSPFAENYENCQRYYIKSYEYEVKAGTVVTLGMVQYSVPASYPAFAPIPFARKMAKAPTMAVYSPATGAVNAVRDTIGGVDRTVSLIANASQTGFSGVDLSTRPGAVWMCNLCYIADTGF